MKQKKLANCGVQPEVIYLIVYSVFPAVLMGLGA